MNKMNKRIYAGTTLMIIISSILIEIKSYNIVFIRIKIAIILLTFILIGTIEKSRSLTKIFSPSSMRRISSPRKYLLFL